MSKSKVQKEKKQASLIVALIPILFMVVLLAVGKGILKLRVEPLLIVSAMLASFITWRLGYSWKDIETAIVSKISRALPAILILWSVGFLIGSWMFSGTVPMIIYYGVQIVNPKFLIVSAFFITAVVSTVTGTSWGSAGTIGVAIMGIAGGLGVSLPATAGAVVAGAYFGDKLSPLSDTTNLAPIAAGSQLYDHIKHMLWTTLPAALVSAVVYTIVGLKATGSISTPETVTVLLNQLDGMFSWNILLLLPALLIIIGSMMKWPTIPTMISSTFLSLGLGIIIQSYSLTDGFTSIVKGFNVTMTGFEGEAVFEVTRLINRGGVNSVTGTTVLIFCAMAFAGAMSCSGMLDVVLAAIMSKVKKTSGLILSTIASCATVAFVTGSSYLSIIIPGELFADAYKQRGLAAKNLSRTLEDSGTVLVPLIPWSAAGAYMSSTLGVSTIEYLPWAILNYTGIIFAIILAITGIGIAKITEEDESEAA